MIPRIIPTLLLDGNGLVKTISFGNKTYIGDPINTVRLFNDMEVDELIFLDINSKKNNHKINFELLREVASECFMPLAYGGGINKLDDIRRLFEIGFEKVIVNSATIENPELIIEASRLFGSQSIVGSIDIKKNLWGRKKVTIHGATKTINIDASNHALNLQNMGCGEIFLNSVDHEGRMNGFDIELIKSVTSKVNIPLIASGGAGNCLDLRDAIHVGNASAVAAGSLFVYHGKTKGILINYPTQQEIKDLFKNE
jgi:imidazole glycerol-phosphate synthase subunit HisF